MKRSPLRRRERTKKSTEPSHAVSAFAEAFVIFALFLAVKTAVPLAAAFFGCLGGEVSLADGFRSAKSSWIVSPVSAVILVLILSVSGRSGGGPSSPLPGMTLGKTSPTTYFASLLFGCTLQLSVSASTVLAVGESAASAAIGQSTALRIISAAVFSAPCEEVIFRSGIFKKLRSASSLPAAVLMSSLFFALCHPSPQAAVYSFAAGAVFALMLEKYESVLPPIAAHASFNLFALALPLIRERGTAIAVLCVCLPAALFLAAILCVPYPQARQKKSCPTAADGDKNENETIGDK